MIELLRTENIEDANGSSYEKGIIAISQPIFHHDDVTSNIGVYKFEDDDFFCIDISNKLSNKRITELLDTTFQNFFRKNGESVNFELYIPDVITNSELFDSLTTIFYLGSNKEKSYVRIQIAQDFILENNIWGKYSTFYLYDELIKLGSKKSSEKFTILQGEDDTEELVRLEFFFDSNQNLNNALKNVINHLPQIETDLRDSINSNIWSEDFYYNEAKFSKELILPLLRKMQFDNVTFNHGKKEYGRDFIFSATNKFGEINYYGMQIKAGDISGKVNSEIDMLIGQLNDAFSMPFYLLGSKEPKYISVFIIAISGNFMENAKEKIMYKIPSYFLGNIYFWDKSKILELIEKNWSE